MSTVSTLAPALFRLLTVHGSRHWGESRERNARGQDCNENGRLEHGTSDEARISPSSELRRFELVLQARTLVLVARCNTIIDDSYAVSALEHTGERPCDSARRRVWPCGRIADTSGYVCCRTDCPRFCAESGRTQRSR